MMKTTFMTRMALAGAVAVTTVSCSAAHLNADSDVPPTGTAIELVTQAFRGANGPEYVAEMALSEDYVNMAVSRSGIYRVPKYGGEVVTVEQDFSQTFGALVAGRDTVLWARTPVTGDTAPHSTTVMKQTGVDAPVVLAELPLDGLASYSPPFRLGASTLYMQVKPVGGAWGWYAMPLEGGELRLVAPLRRTPEFTPEWFLAEPYIYYVEYPDDPTVNCSVKRVDVSGGGTPEDLSPSPGADRTFGTWIVAVDDTDIFVAWGGGFWKVPKTGGAATLLYRASDSRLFVSEDAAVMDAQNLYFVIGAVPYPNQILAKLMSVPKTGGAATLIYDGDYVSNDLLQLAQDDSNLFMRLGGVAFVPKMPPAP
jgi:hypothetical protein